MQGQHAAQQTRPKNVPQPSKSIQLAFSSATCLAGSISAPAARRQALTAAGRSPARSTSSSSPVARASEASNSRRASYSRAPAEQHVADGGVVGWHVPSRWPGGGLFMFRADRISVAGPVSHALCNESAHAHSVRHVKTAQRPEQPKGCRAGTPAHPPELVEPGRPNRPSPAAQKETPHPPSWQNGPDAEQIPRQCPATHPGWWTQSPAR